MSQQRKAYIFGLTTVLLWSTVASAFKLSLNYLSPAELLLYADGVSVLVLGGLLLLRGHGRLVISCSARQYRQSLLLGLLNPFLYYLVLFEAYDLLPAQIAQPLNYTWALTLALLSIPLLKQRIGVNELLAGCICYSGVVVISTHGRLASLQIAEPLGVVLALGSTIIWALYWIYNTRDQRDPVLGLFLQFLMAFPAILLYVALVTGLRQPHPYGLLGAAYIGIFEMGVTFVLWLMALKHSENTAKVGNLIFLSPFLSLLFIHFLVGETILPSTVFGLVLIVGGLLLQRFAPFGPPAGEQVGS